MLPQPGSVLPNAQRKEGNDVKADKLKDAVRRWQQKSTKSVSSVASPGKGGSSEDASSPAAAAVLRGQRSLAGNTQDYTRQISSQTYMASSGIVAAVKAAAAEGNASMSTGPANFTGPLPFTEIMRLKKEGRSKPAKVTLSRPASPTPATGASTSPLEAGEVASDEGQISPRPHVKPQSGGSAVGTSSPPQIQPMTNKQTLPKIQMSPRPVASVGESRLEGSVPSLPDVETPSDPKPPQIAVRQTMSAKKAAIPRKLPNDVSKHSTQLTVQASPPSSDGSAVRHSTKPVPTSRPALAQRAPGPASVVLSQVQVKQPLPAKLPPPKSVSSPAAPSEAVAKTEHVSAPTRAAEGQSVKANQTIQPKVQQVIQPSVTHQESVAQDASQKPPPDDSESQTPIRSSAAATGMVEGEEARKVNDKTDLSGENTVNSESVLVATSTNRSNSEDSRAGLNAATEDVANLKTRIAELTRSVTELDGTNTLDELEKAIWTVIDGLKI